ncbi:aminotransferase class V-fold PLP-dependent enzyme [Aestuariirhabdus sp. Z084]|uniref:aminotransferase class V-fold PLP-dependent enzyme n=1 Tax=Aestuariirhabdus haliotis TaxID=2918751 RepID=UPI00201B40C3|nr:aminotransferase class V-fold PLP-dependent enzyme [Aestuariirhabdus haliotis]MCL6414665.1 aminotransferase class V-fold PLP-dependent enzyme [Aestuariirhabdus haliotis]MCL6418353.1 aminotransferase class V-fold PLP-dependent enzyme [Aestuariirhabdus haliotis]
MSVQQLIKTIRESVIGEGRPLQTPFGLRPLVYADYTASGRSLDFIERYIQEHVLPWYANTHTETSATGLQTTSLREEARELIKRSVQAGEEDLVIFCGSGATAAVHKLIDILNLRLPAELNDRYRLLDQVPEEQRPVVFIGPYEHHSNELPWRESIADLVTIGLDAEGDIDLSQLEAELVRFQDRPLKIGSFSAGSNVTGLLTNTTAISRLLHRHDALSFWDYAAAAPYVEINMQGEGEGSHQDALFISPHKFVGGPGTPGLLILNRKLLSNRVPSVPGGGTVSWVSPDSHCYLKAGERREEGGTPAIIESIRAGLVFQLKDAVGAQTIERLEHEFVRAALRRWRENSQISVLGDLDKPRTSIVSLQIRSGGKVLHHGFVTALLNDLFGIQVRGGCSCAGPYGHELLGMDQPTSEAIETSIGEGNSVLKPGWVRLNFNYFISRDTFEYLVRAMELVADYGWRMLGHYQFNAERGVWGYKGALPTADIRLGDINYQSGSLSFSNPNGTDQAAQLDQLSDYLVEAEQLMQSIEAVDSDCGIQLEANAEALRWFSLPTDQGLMAEKH